MSKKFQIFYTDENNKNRTDVIVAILNEECKSYELIQDIAKVHKSTRGTSMLAIFHLDEYIGYNYRDLVQYLNDKGLVLC
jgi:hypothetical protein